MAQERALERLFRKYITDQLTADERAELRLLLEEESNRMRWDELAHQSLVEPVSDDFLEDPAVKEELAQSFSTIRRRIAPPKHRRMLFPAAAAILALAIGLWWFAGGSNQPSAPALASEFGSDALPGRNKAHLTLPNGERIPLSGEQSGIVVNKGVRYENGDMVVRETGATLPATADTLLLSTPAGGQYAVTFSDGSRVWLNAGSTLKYPMRFGDECRSVVLEGEGYFEVEPDAIPFSVHTAGQTVTVLGTAFNIHGYPEEGQVETTLVNGSVTVSNHHSGTVHRLRPGQQSIVNVTQTAINDVAVTDFTAWRQGMFIFNDTELTKAINQLARWYNVDVVYEGAPPNTSFFGEIGRDKSLSQVLSLLKRSGVNFRIKEAVNDRKVLTVIP